MSLFNLYIIKLKNIPASFLNRIAQFLEVQIFETIFIQGFGSQKNLIYQNPIIINYK